MCVGSYLSKSLTNSTVLQTRGQNKDQQPLLVLPDEETTDQQATMNEPH